MLPLLELTLLLPLPIEDGEEFWTRMGSDSSLLLLRLLPILPRMALSLSLLAAVEDGEEFCARMGSEPSLLLLLLLPPLLTL